MDVLTSIEIQLLATGVRRSRESVGYRIVNLGWSRDLSTNRARIVAGHRSIQVDRKGAQQLFLT